MRTLGSLVASYGMEALLDYSHAMIVLVGPRGELKEFNSAFETHKKNFPEIQNLYEVLPAGQENVFREWVTRAHRINQPGRQLINLLAGTAQDAVCYECLIIPLPNAETLFVAERVTSEAVDDVVQKLTRQVRLFKVESEHAKKIAINKQIELEAIIAQANEVQNIDQLTSLPNRRWIMNALQTAVLYSERQRTALSISMLDVDHFKKINDTYGHIAGDEALQQIGQNLQVQIRRYLNDDIREVDTAGRYGGEEFLILLPNTPIESAKRQADRICNAMRELSIKVGQETVSLTVSIGIAEFRFGSETWDKLLDRADKALYQAKKQGRDRWVAIEN